jgi:excinuclease ABC subunit C
VRDEAHRFAITAHRTRRDKAGVASVLDSIPGIGPSRRKALLSHFGGIDAIREATLEEIRSVKGMNEKLAQSVKENLG